VTVAKEVNTAGLGAGHVGHARIHEWAELKRASRSIATIMKVAWRIRGLARHIQRETGDILK
jgi:hypothetical protein